MAENPVYNASAHGDGSYLVPVTHNPSYTAARSQAHATSTAASHSNGPYLVPVTQNPNYSPTDPPAHVNVSVYGESALQHAPNTSHIPGEYATVDEMASQESVDESAFC